MNDKLPARKARQGRKGFPVLAVLVVSLVLAGIVWALVEYYGMFIDEQQPRELPSSSDIPVDEGGALPQQEGY
ncbi:hypothetical protein [Nitratireductor luteus]|uniref:hypothetical protein n=1 Tax=Nitratireductor luteus TaxID=2976980 RepID=UPI00223FF545|nr:hypothetical protein [Nitratireductor luteus]